MSPPPPLITPARWRTRVWQGEDRLSGGLPGGAAGWGRLAFPAAPFSRPHTQRSRSSSWLAGIAGIPPEGASSPSSPPPPQPGSGRQRLALRPSPPPSPLPEPHCAHVGLSTLTSARPGFRGPGERFGQVQPTASQGIPGPVPSFFPLRGGKVTFDCPWMPVLAPPSPGEAEGGGARPALLPRA